MLYLWLLDKQSHKNKQKAKKGGGEASSAVAVGSEIAGDIPLICVAASDRGSIRLGVEGAGAIIIRHHVQVATITDRSTIQRSRESAACAVGGNLVRF